MDCQQFGSNFRPAPGIFQLCVGHSGASTICCLDHHPTGPTVHEHRQSSEGIAQHLKTRILAGEFRPGQRLTEMDLAAEYGAGRGRVREAFRILVGQGFLEFVANRGVLIRRYDREEFLSMGRAREVLEGLAARLAAERALNAEERAELSALQDRMDGSSAARDLDAFSVENREFHALIARLAGNEHIIAFLERVNIPLARLQLPVSFAADSIERSNLDHRTITMAILSGSPAAAEAAMRAHVQAGNRHIASLNASDF